MISLRILIQFSQTHESRYVDPDISTVVFKIKMRVYSLKICINCICQLLYCIVRMHICRTPTLVHIVHNINVEISTFIEYL